MTEKEIIKGCIKKERRAQSALYELYYPLMRNIISRYANQHDDKSSLINSGFFKVLKNIKAYDEQFALATWIRNVVINNCIDEYRKVKNKETNVSIEDLEEVPVQLDFNQGLKNLEEKDLLEILNVLPNMSRKVFNLFAIDGFKHNEIAELLSISAGTSRWHLNFARTKLKELITNQLVSTTQMIQIEDEE
jgi:RNA polymerase sigma factor (sigma-70 family)